MVTESIVTNDGKLRDDMDGLSSTSCELTREIFSSDNINPGLSKNGQRKQMNSAYAITKIAGVEHLQLVY